MTITDRPTRSSARGVLASESRLQLLDALRKNSDGMDANELAQLFGLHVSTVRFHLGELRRAGLVDAHSEAGVGRGRPRKLFYPVTVGGAYSAADARGGNAPAASGYEHLARVLAASWDIDDPYTDDPHSDDPHSDDPYSNASGASARVVAARSVRTITSAVSNNRGRLPSSSSSNSNPKSNSSSSARARRRAEAAGRSWAASQLHSSPVQDPTAREAAAKISGLFSEIGFDPELRQDGEISQILLHSCPFESVARDYPLVCTLHFGLLRGGLDQLGADVESELQSKVTPNLCIAYIGPRSSNAFPPAS